MCYNSGMTNELSIEECTVITTALAQRADACAEQIDRGLTRLQVEEGARRLDNLSYWIKSWLQASRTLVRAREVFWS